MKFLKVSCIRCSQYKECPQTTRLYVNYCGSDSKRVEKQICDATEDCRTRRGFLSVPRLLPTVTLPSVIPNALGSARG